ncbi:protein of unknown function [Paenibacillus alvei]|uniref:Uncharacterized protein n=1 Tax=Paenibacillus alvei TaxID=44250 RepID=A0A383RGJ5_PAEAL|nr:protein of unknown function [Paenibacillus alvei]
MRWGSPVLWLIGLYLWMKVEYARQERRMLSLQIPEPNEPGAFWIDFWTLKHGKGEKLDEEQIGVHITDGDGTAYGRAVVRMRL